MAHGYGRAKKADAGSPDDELLAVLAGYSLRLIAIDLHGEALVEEKWCPNGWKRARVRYRVKKSIELMNGGYRALIAGSG